MGVAVFESFHMRGKALSEFVVDRSIHNDAVGTHANLSLVEEPAEHRSRNGAVQVGIIKNNERGISAEFQRHPLYPGPPHRQAGNVLSDRGGPSKRDQGWNGMQNESIANL